MWFRGHYCRSKQDNVYQATLGDPSYGDRSRGSPEESSINQSELIPALEMYYWLKLWIKEMI